MKQLFCLLLISLPGFSQTTSTALMTDRAAARAHLVSAQEYLSRVIDINPDHEYSAQARKYVDVIKARLARLQGAE